MAGATALVGLDGFVVRSQTRRDGEQWLLVETTESRSACRECGVFGVGNGRRHVTVRDLPIAGVPAVIVWAKRTWRCRQAQCQRGSWSETSPRSPASSGSAGRAPIRPSSTTATR